MTDFPAWARVIAAASPFGPEPITTASYCRDWATKSELCAYTAAKQFGDLLKAIAPDFRMPKPGQAKAVQIDIDPTRIGLRYPVEVGLVADTRISLKALRPTLRRHEAVDEALKLESALARLRTSQRVALLHYAPIPQTIAGEPPEVFAFSWMQQARRTSGSLRGNRGHSRPRASRQCRRPHKKRSSCFQRRDGSYGACLSGSPPLPDSGAACGADAILAGAAPVDSIGGRVTRNVVPTPALLEYSIAPP